MTEFENTLWVISFILKMKLEVEVLIDRAAINMLKNANHYPFPKMIQLEITNHCPFACPQCYKKLLSDQDMNLSQIIAYIDECADKGTSLFVLNGGEPFLHKDFIKIAEYLTNKKVYFNCFTSGYAFNTGVFEYVNSGYFKLYISLNGSNEKINSLSRDGFEYAVNAIKVLSNSNTPFFINWVARHDNVYDFPRMIELAKEYNAKGISIIGNKLVNNKFIDSPLEKDDYFFFM